VSKWPSSSLNLAFTALVSSSGLMVPTLILLLVALSPSGLRRCTDECDAGRMFDRRGFDPAMCNPD
jgi:hypothetical protein